MRVLTVIAEMGSGGAESVVADLAGHLVATGDEACVASNGGWRADALASAGVETLAVPLRASGPTRLAAAVARLRRETAARPVDVVHAHNIRASLAAHLGSRAGRRSRPPLVTSVHGLADGDYARAARVLAFSDLVVAVSDDVADRLARGGLTDARLRVVENAVPGAGRPPTASRCVPSSGSGHHPSCSASPGWRRPSGSTSWSTPGRTCPTRPSSLAGDGPDRAALERRAAALGDRVRFLGERRDVGRLLQAADLLVLPSDREGLPMAVLEALAAGVPVVASDVGGIPQLGADAVELVAPQSADALAEGIRRVLGDPDRRQALVAGGRGWCATDSLPPGCDPTTRTSTSQVLQEARASMTRS